MQQHSQFQRSTSVIQAWYVVCNAATRCAPVVSPPLLMSPYVQIARPCDPCALRTRRMCHAPNRQQGKEWSSANAHTPTGPQPLTQVHQPRGRRREGCAVRACIGVCQLLTSGNPRISPEMCVGASTSFCIHSHRATHKVHQYTHRARQPRDNKRQRCAMVTAHGNSTGIRAMASHTGHHDPPAPSKCPR